MPESRTISTGAGASRSQRDRVKYMSPRVIGIRTDTSAKNATDIGLTQDQKKMVLAEEGRIRGR